MASHFTKTTQQFLALGIAIAAAAAQAQTMPAQTMGGNNAYDANRTSWIPYTHNGYVGLNAGRSDYNNRCGAIALRCEDGATAGHIYLGGYFTPYFGAEIGYLDMGNIDRAGGTTDAYGVNLSLIGRVPVSQYFSVYGKLGSTYGRTRVSSLAGTGITAGRESGWGPSYALGVSWDIDKNWSALLEVERNRFDFAGNNDHYVRSTSVGLKYSF